VAELREEAGMTQDDLAERLDVSVKYIQRVERGVENLGLDSLVRLANALKTAPAAFFVPADPARAKRSAARPRARGVSGNLPE
jgi:transcriptional regulator with XRE-family HTH domain